jgi:hypothetical protein
MGVAGFAVLVVALTVISLTREPGGCDVGEVEAGAAAFHLFVSNQSFEIDPVRIDVMIDGRRVICQEFFVEGQHNWVQFDYQLDGGVHTLNAIAHEVNVETEIFFDMRDRERWGVLNFWSSPDEEQTFTFDMFDEPVGFD